MTLYTACNVATLGDITFEDTDGVDGTTSFKYVAHSGTGSIKFALPTVTTSDSSTCGDLEISVLNASGNAFSETWIAVTEPTSGNRELEFTPASYTSASGFAGTTKKSVTVTVRAKLADYNLVTKDYLVDVIACTVATLVPPASFEGPSYIVNGSVNPTSAKSKTLPLWTQ